VRVVAVDWSGRLKRAEQSLWLAEVRDGELTDLRSGRTRKQLIAHLIRLGADDPRLLVGLDFAFSFPAWWCAEQRWRAVPEVWTAIADRGERLLAACDAPFWGQPGRPNPHPRHRLYRRTELEEGGGAKSVFQIGGAGAVGTGSIRGMPHLLDLAENGFGVWPFAQHWPRVVEIYPRLLTGRVRKSSWAARHTHVFERFPEQARDLLERAAGSEDAFDAAVSALVMSAHEDELRELSSPSESEYMIEGKIWRP
jgi:hypothetical protein